MENLASAETTDETAGIVHLGAAGGENSTTFNADSSRY
jgi:hypothetical protein